jgi:hypothetical protein
MVGPGSILAGERVLPVPKTLAPLFPAAGLQRGTLVGISGPASASLLLSLLVEPLAQGSWAAAVGLPDLGLEAAAAAGVDLRRLALVPDPGASWTTVVAVLLDTLDVVVLGPPGSCRPAEARRLAARARQRGSILLIAGAALRWPDHRDLELTVEAGDWEGLDRGAGTLIRRPARVMLSGRRGGGRSRSATCWLPGPDGRLSPRRVKEEVRGREEEVVQVPEALPWAG